MILNMIKIVCILYIVFYSVLGKMMSVRGFQMHLRFVLVAQVFSLLWPHVVSVL